MVDSAEKVVMLELRVADLETQLTEWTEETITADRNSMKRDLECLRKDLAESRDLNLKHEEELKKLNILNAALEKALESSEAKLSRELQDKVDGLLKQPHPLKDNQQLLLQLQQYEKQLADMLKRLEQAQVNATTKHKESTQLQTQCRIPTERSKP
jgi:ribosome-binding ATPase YchF (GTP1/OBG family)